MFKRRVLGGLSLFCALLFSAIAVSNAAAIEGTTAVTCVKKTTVGGAGFSKEHCKTGDKVETGASFESVAIAGETKEIEATNEKTDATTSASTKPVLKTKIAGLSMEIECTTLTSTGTLKNEESEGKHKVSLLGTVTKAMGCSLKGSLATTEGCKLEKEEITSASIKGVSIEDKMEYKLEPTAGTVLATFKLAGCKTPALNEATQELKGTALVKGDGATLETTAASTEPTLTLAGQKVSFTSITTRRMKGGNPVASLGF